MDLVLYNGKVYNHKEFYEAIAIRGEYIYSIGNNEDILSLVQKGTIVIDLQEKLVLPGFNDSHLHLYSTGKSLQNVNLLGEKSIKDIKETVRIFIKNNPHLHIIKGRGWNQDYFIDEKRFLTKADLDDITQTLPLILYRACGHIATVNSRALALIKKDQKIEGGYIDFEKGILYENALTLFENDDSVATIKQTLLQAMEYANKYGITSVQSDDFGSNYQPIIQAYEELRKENLLTCRVYEQCLLPNLNLFQEFLSKGYKTGIGNDYFKIGPLKLLSDGSLGARTAAISIPYKDNPETQGMLIYRDEELEELLTIADKNEMQIVVHAIGDRAIKQVLKIYQKLIKDNNKLRHGIIHSQIMDKEIHDLYKKLDILTLVQPIFIHYDHRIVTQRVGKELSKTSYAFKTLYDFGVKVAFGTDSPVESLNPFANLYCAITRKDLEQMPATGWHPKERFNLIDALSLYTIGSSYASFEENKKGKLEKGYLADLIVLNQNIFEILPEKLLDTEVQYTIVGGKIVYRK